MINKYTHKELVWVDLESPSRDEVTTLMTEYGLDPLIAQELLTPTYKPKFELHDNFACAVLNFPVLRNKHTKRTSQEINFLIGKNVIITTHYDTIDPLHKFSRLFEVNSMLEKSTLGEHAGYVFFFMMKRLYASLDNEIDYIAEQLVEIEADIYADKEKEMVFALSRANRSILDFKQAILHHKEIVSSFEQVSDKFFGPGFTPYLQSIREEYIKIWDNLHSQADLISELRSTNDSLLDLKQSEIMKLFTVLAFITFPLTLLVQMMSINSPYNPILGSHYDFWIISGVAIVAVVSMFLYFRHKKWL